MTYRISPWGANPTDRYEQLAGHFRPLFEEISNLAAYRDQERVLPHDAVAQLRQSGFFRLRLPRQHNGQEVTLPELFSLLIELGAADPNLANIARPHLGFTEGILVETDQNWRNRWLAILGRGDTIGSGFSETGGASLGAFETRLEPHQDEWRLSGKKAYTTGSLFSDWIAVAASDPENQLAITLVSTRQDGVSITDDWNGFGQSLTGSGTAVFERVIVTKDMIAPRRPGGSYTSSFPQMVHLATLAGIARAIALDTAKLVRERKRIYIHGNNLASSEDPQIQQVVGKLFGIAYTTRAIVLKIAQSFQTAYELQRTQSIDAARDAAIGVGLEVSQSVNVLSTLVLDAATLLFDTLGASAVRSELALDRHWRNARTISSHNPRVYHDRVVADHYLNGTVPPEFSISVGTKA